MKNNNNKMGSGNREDQGPASPGKKLSRPLPISTNKKLRVAVCVCLNSYCGSINKRITVQASPGVNSRPYPGRGDRGEQWRGDFKYDIFDTF
jgi:hypothetical protein